ncbi:hypothetical protein Tco_0765978 [Tanacetum coccineum]
MEEFATNDKENYYSGIESIMVNGKRAYELKGKFLANLLDNAFSGTNGEDTVEHIEYFLKIIDPINLPNEFSDAEKANNDDEQETAEIFRIETKLFDYETLLCTEFKEFNFILKFDPELFTRDIEITKTYEDYENELNDELEKPWSEDGVPYEISDHICEPFHFKMGKLNGPLAIQMKTDSDYERYNELADGNLKEEALKQKAIYEKSWGDASQSVMNFYAWLKRSFRNFHKLDYEQLVKIQDYWWKVNDHECSPFSNWRNHIKGPYANYYSNFLDNEEHENNDKHGLFDNQKRSVCKTRRFKIIKYSFSEDEEYVAIKEHEYDDLTSTSEEACQEIFHRMDEA